MADYVEIEDSEIDPESPITTSLMTRLRDNPFALNEFFADESDASQSPALTNVSNGGTTALGYAYDPVTGPTATADARATLAALSVTPKDVGVPFIARIAFNYAVTQRLDGISSGNNFSTSVAEPVVGLFVDSEANARDWMRARLIASSAYVTDNSLTRNTTGAGTVALTGSAAVDLVSLAGFSDLLAKTLTFKQFFRITGATGAGTTITTKELITFSITHRRVWCSGAFAA